MRIQDKQDEERSELPKANPVPERSLSSRELRQSEERPLRPVRSTVKENVNYVSYRLTPGVTQILNFPHIQREPLLGTKMRNDNSQVVIKNERLSNRRGSAKENAAPELQKTVSQDEGIASATESNAKSDVSGKRSNSVEIINPKAVEIDITSESECDKMPPPAVPTKKAAAKIKRTKNKTNDDHEEREEAPLRVTRSRIKQEKISIVKPAQQPVLEASVSSDPKVSETSTTKKTKKV